MKKEDVKINKWYVIECYGYRYRVYVINPYDANFGYIQGLYQVYNPKTKKYEKNVLGSRNHPGGFGETLKNITPCRKGSKLPKISKERL